MCYQMHGPSMMSNAFLRWREGIPGNGVHIAGREGEQMWCGDIALRYKVTVFKIVK